MKDVAIITYFLMNACTRRCSTFMKRISILLILLIMPLSVWAMTPVSDADLSTVTGQAGVNINADLTMNVCIGTMAWGDEDGLTTDGSWPTWVTTDDGGYVGVKDFNITYLRIKARENDTYTGYNTNQLKPITIDVANDPTLYSGRTFVRLGLGSLQISMDELHMTVALDPHTGFDGTLAEEMGSVNIGDLALYIAPQSFVDIYSHSGQGVNITMAVRFDRVFMDYISWGDSDGLPAGNTGTGGCVWMAGGGNSGAGYIGLSNIRTVWVYVAGTVAIDVNTTTAGIYAAAHDGDPTTVVHLSFPARFYLTVSQFIADVKLGSVPSLANTNAGTLGTVYLRTLQAHIREGSWVDIWAH